MKFKGIIIMIASIIAVILLIVVVLNSIPAMAIGLEEKVTEAQSAIKVQEKRRADLIPNLIDCVKAYDKHEYETLMDIVKARTASDGSITDELVSTIKEGVHVVVESYPELNSQTNYTELMNELSITENIISESRNAYNKAVTRYNTYVRNPIYKFFLSMMKYEFMNYEKLDYETSAPTKIFETEDM